MRCFTSTPAIPRTQTQVLSPLLAAPNQQLTNKWARLQIEIISFFSTRKHYASQSSSLWQCISITHHVDQKDTWGRSPSLKLMQLYWCQWNYTDLHSGKSGLLCRAGTGKPDVFGVTYGIELMRRSFNLEKKMIEYLCWTEILALPIIYWTLSVGSWQSE